MSIIKRTADNSYVIDKNGLPYHIPNEGEFADEWAEINAYAEAHPDEVILEEPYVPTEEELAEAEKQAAIAQANALLEAKSRANLVQTASFTASEFSLLAKAELFPVWTAGETYPQGPPHTARRYSLRSSRGGRRNRGSPPAAERRRAARSLSSAIDRPIDRRNAHGHAGRPHTIHRRHGRGERQVLQLQRQALQSQPEYASLRLDSGHRGPLAVDGGDGDGVALNDSAKFCLWQT